MCYWLWIRQEAATIRSDGCTLVTDFRVECCFEHDLAYFYGRDPRDAYRRFKAGDPYPWVDAARISFEEANIRFRSCYQQRSWFRALSPVAWIRYLGVKFGGREIWERHRERERQAELGV